MARAEHETRNARITDTMLGIEDHGLFVMAVFFEYDRSAAQGFNRILASKANDNGVASIRTLLETLALEQWEQLKGAYCRVLIEDGMIRQVGHIVEDRWTHYTWGEG